MAIQQSHITPQSTLENTAMLPTDVWLLMSPSHWSPVDGTPDYSLLLLEAMSRVLIAWIRLNK